jgi:glycosyltransferase involved in cell wall biosynthesis
MTSQVATIIRCADLARHVYSTVESVERQTLSGGEIALVTDESTPAGTLKWLTAFAKAKGLVLAKAPGKRPGAARNAGIRSTKAPFVMCLDAGELLDRRFHECAQAELEQDAAVEVVTSWVDLAGPGSEVRTTAPKSADLKSLIGNTASIHDASVFRRKTWSAVEGFDEKLTALETYDFWLRVLGTDGRKCALIETPLLIRPLREDALYRRSWAAENHAGGTQRVAEKHAALFAQDPGAALEARELVLRAIGDDYKRLLSRRDAGVRDLESLKAKAASLQASVSEISTGRPRYRETGATSADGPSTGTISSVFSKDTRPTSVAPCSKCRNPITRSASAASV